MNHHPLTGDFNMYYNGTYIFRYIDGVPHTMMVEGTERDGDDTQLDGVLMCGQVYNESDNLGYQQWRASTMEAARPFSGYFAVYDGTRERQYITWNVNNRSQRKGVDPRNAVLHGAPGNGLNGSQVCKVLAQTADMNCKPGMRDLYVDSKDVVHWKGMKVGARVEGAFSPDDKFKQIEVLICRLLQSI